MRLLQWLFLRKMAQLYQKAILLQVQRNGRIPGNTVADWRSQKHHDCLGIVVAGFRNMAGQRGGAQKQTTHQETKTKLSSATPNRDKPIHCHANTEKSIPPAMSQRNQHLTPRLVTRQLCGSGCVCRPEFSIIRLKNNSIYLKPDESFVDIGVSISWLQQIP